MVRENSKSHVHCWFPLDCTVLAVDDFERWVAVRFVCVNEECNMVKVLVEKLHDVGRAVET